MGTRVIRKRLSYWDGTGASQEAVRAHWAGFEWQAGPVIVGSVGPWGNVQVWASSEEEGKRVIRHAAAQGGWDPDDPAVGRWIVTSSQDSRYGRAATMRVKERAGVLWISKRAGPSGAPFA